MSRSFFRKGLLACSIGMLFTGNAMAAATSSGPATPLAPAAQVSQLPNADKIIKTMEAIQTQIKIVSIINSPSPDLYTLKLEDGSEVYATKDGNFIVAGQLWWGVGGKAENLTELAQKKVSLEKLASVKESDMIIYPAEKKKTVITVFTDVDCPYCQVLHKDVPKLNAAGIEIRYLAYPRMGLNTETYKKMEQVWCSKDRRQALDIAKSSDLTATDTCENPVADQYHLAGKMGIRGTPTIFLENGERVGGYAPPERLIKMALDAQAK
ncbi:DsbC family protein [Pseudomonas sp. PLMAX]|uniref:DsbC family protein n=1 Tax=Pseudomonas sp. PLMAX TaxID=2201998 RepID=UPI0038B7B7D0